jgi:conjugal transfer pilus assembly protein TraK
MMDLKRWRFKVANKLIALMTVLFLFSNPLIAKQEYEVGDGESVTFQLSASELTRIAIAGEGRIIKAWTASGALEIKPDMENGEIFVRSSSPSKAVSLFVRDDSGSIYTLVGAKHDIPSETVILKPKRKVKRKASETSASYYSLPLVIKVKSLIKAMALEGELDEYAIVSLNRIVPLWKETYIRYREQYQGYELLGEIYTIRNISNEKLRLTENEFLEFGGETLAVALDSLVLAPGQKTNLYVVRKHILGED